MQNGYNQRFNGYECLNANCCANLAGACERIERQRQEYNSGEVTSMRPLRKVGIVLAVVAFLPLFYGEIRLHAHRWNPLKIPITLTAGKIQTGKFATDLTGTYVLSVVFERLPDFRREDCLVGDQFPIGSCEVRRALNLDWTVTTDQGVEIAHARFEPCGFSYSAGEVGADLGRFDADAGARYIASIRVLPDAPELNLGHPYLQVEAHEGIGHRGSYSASLHSY